MIEHLTRDDALYFCPLGGAEQFGVNLNVYIASGKMLAIDCGIGFADERFPGIDLLLPDPELLQDNKDDLVGMFITHAHEDHVGAVAYLWSRFKCPLYATPFTAAILRKKLDEHNVKGAHITVVDMNTTLDLSPFELQILPVSHSVPDACSLLVKANGVSALHSGDWNLDPKPVVGYKTEEHVFSKACGNGVDVYIGDSTNSGVPGVSGSESEVEVGLYDEFSKFSGRIFVTTFSSNIGRLQSILRAAKRCERKVAVIGRSMHRMLGTAIELGLVDDDSDLLSGEDLSRLSDDKVLFVCTGSQGESRAALSRMARGDHQTTNTKHGDTVIFSARTIPGNEMAINSVKNDLIASGVRVVTPRDTKNIIHVSGHPCQDEILKLWQWVKPKAVIPVHGEREQLDAHAKLANSVQINDVIVPQNGSVIEVTSSGINVVDNIETGLLAVDQKRIITARHRSIVSRRKLQYTGACFVSMALNKKGKVSGDIYLETLGLIDDQCETDLKIEDQLYDEVFDTLDDMRKDDKMDDEFVAEKVRINVRRKVNQILGMRPRTIVHVLRVA